MRPIFVSSTFKDMQFERDLLKTKVAPLLDVYLKKYGETISFSDLRWGVNTTELDEASANKKVLKICLDEIDNCKPYIIVFIGERYGWIPPKSLIEEELNEKDLKGIDSNISVTNLEIEYGAFLNPDLEGRVLFYFRKPIDTSKMSNKEKEIYEVESNEHKEKLDDLKKRIIETFPSQYVKEYEVYYDEQTKTLKGYDKLEKMLLEDLEKILTFDYEKENELTRFEKAYRNASNYFKKYYEHAYINDADIVTDEIDEYEGKYHFHSRFSSYPIINVIVGEEGSGRKTRLAIKYFRSREKNHISFPYVCNLDQYSNAEDSFKRYMFDALKIKGEYSKEKLFEAIENNKKQITFYIMGIDETTFDFIKEIEANIPELKYINFVFSMDDIDGNPYSYPFPYFLHNHIEEVEPLDKEEQKAVIQSVTRSKHKELSEVVIKEIMKKEGANNPLYLSLIVERLMMLDYNDFQNIRNQGDGMNAINEYMVDIVRKSGNNLKSLAKDVIKVLIEHINKNMLVRIISSMTLSYHMPVSVLENLFNYYGWEFSSSDLSLFIYSVPSLFKVRSQGNEYLEFSSDVIIEAAKEVLEDYNIDNINESFEKYLLAELEKDKYSFSTYESLSFVYKTKNDPIALANLLIRLFDYPFDEVSDEETGLFRDYFSSSITAINSVVIMMIKKEGGLHFAYQYQTRLIEAFLNHEFKLINLYYYYAFMYVRRDVFEDNERYNHHLFDLLLYLGNLLIRDKENEKKIYQIIALVKSYIQEPSKFIAIVDRFYDDEEVDIIRETYLSDESDEALMDLIEYGFVSTINETKNILLSEANDYIQNKEVREELHENTSLLISTQDEAKEVFDAALNYDLDNSIDDFENIAYTTNLAILLSSISYLQEDDIDNAIKYLKAGLNTLGFTIRYDDNIVSHIELLNYNIRLALSAFDELKEYADEDTINVFNAMYYVALETLKGEIKYSEMFMGHLEIISILLDHYQDDEAHQNRRELIESDYLYYQNILFYKYNKWNEDSDVIELSLNTLIKFYYIYEDDEFDFEFLKYSYLYAVSVLNENNDFDDVLGNIACKVAIAFLVSKRDFDEFTYDQYYSLFLNKISDEDNDYTTYNDEFFELINDYIERLSRGEY